MEDNKIFKKFNEKHDSYFQSILNSIGNMSQDIIMVLSQDLKILYVNKSVKAILDYNPKELVGKHPFFFSMESYKKFETQTKNMSGMHDNECMLLTKQNDVKIGLQSFYKIENEDKRSKLLICIFKDISEKQILKEKLYSRDALINQFSRNMPGIVTFIDMAGKVRWINDNVYDILGYNKEDLIGYSFMNIIHPKDRQDVNNYLKKAMKTNKEKVIRHRCKPKVKKNPIFLESVIRSQLDENRNVIGVVTGSINISKRVAAEKKSDISNKRLRESMKGIIEIVSLAHESRDSYTAGHQQRVSDIAKLIANSIGLSRKIIEGIGWAGIIHDIGKISIPSMLLTKPDKLRPTEYDLIKDHCSIGYEITKGIKFDYPVADIIHQHHEKYDGSGYPNGLQGEEILIEAKILCVADVVEAMASKRPYRAALGLNMAIEEITSNRGKKYDPNVVDALLSVKTKLNRYLVTE